jgi:hypothetical protein
VNYVIQRRGDRQVCFLCSGSYSTLTFQKQLFDLKQNVKGKVLMIKLRDILDDETLTQVPVTSTDDLSVLLPLQDLQNIFKERLHHMDAINSWVQKRRKRKVSSTLESEALVNESSSVRLAKKLRFVYGLYVMYVYRCQQHREKSTSPHC